MSEGLREGGTGGLVFNGLRDSVCDNEKVLETDGSAGRLTV